ncbi:MAG: ATP-binding protein [Bacteroidales bacterium]|nr:ATP-binding protein [Bacteroidales bacterium]
MEQSILGCLDEILGSATVETKGKDPKVKFNTDVFSQQEVNIKYVCDMLGVEPVETVLLSAIVESCDDGNARIKEVGEKLGMSFTKLMSYKKELNHLEDLKLIRLSKKKPYVNIPKKILDFLQSNEKYVVPKTTGLNTQQLLEQMQELFSAAQDDELSYSMLFSDLDDLIEDNPENDFVLACSKLHILGKDSVMFMERRIFYIMVYRYIFEDDDAISWDNIEEFFDEKFWLSHAKSDYDEGQLDLQERQIIEPSFEDGMANRTFFHIKDSVKDEIFAEVGGMKKKNKGATMKSITPEKINQKDLFFDESVAGKISKLQSLLMPENFNATCERLKTSGMRTGFTCLFYGLPGTGKTESVYQLAKATGREIVPVNISEMRSMWVGESEKIVKRVFDSYRSMVSKSDLAPILLFNEADGLFGIRQEGATNSVDKMENAIQSILLQEMEKIDGILIATTNLTDNLDKAFERRFLYKLYFDKPSSATKARIWQSMIPDLTVNQAIELASQYDFSGGQIENISRKKMVMGILDGKEPDYNDIRSFCSEEDIATSRKVGY